MYREDFPEPSLLPSKHSQITQLLLIWQILHILNLVVLCWTCTSTPIFLLYWEIQNWTQQLRWVSPVLRGRLTSLELLLMLLPKAVFAVRAHCHLGVYQEALVLFCKVAFYPVGPQHGAWGYFSPWTGIAISLKLKSMTFLFDRLCRLLRSL